MEKTKRKVKAESWINNTWLSPYCNYIVTLIEYKSGRMDLILDGQRMKHVEGIYMSEYNGWSYTIKKLLSRPLK
jgi:hypothetical protein